jgi:predicted Zn-dependent protease
MESGLRLILCGLLAGSAWGQMSGPGSAGQAQKTFELGGRSKDATLADPAVPGYVQALENRLAGSGGRKALDVRITQASKVCAGLLPHNVLEISGGLFEGLASEAELIGLLAYEFEIAQSPERRHAEYEPVDAAMQAMKAAGYDPSALLDLLSKLAYEHPTWGKGISADDLLVLRAKIEADQLPQAGYLVDSSRFIEQRARVSAALRSIKVTRHPGRR